MEGQRLEREKDPGQAQLTEENILSLSVFLASDGIALLMKQVIPIVDKHIARYVANKHIA